MKRLLSLIKRFLPKEAPKPMGRWNTETCNIKMNQKIDLSNEDHCGPCGQYALSIKDNINKETNYKLNFDKLTEDIDIGNKESFDIKKEVEIGKENYEKTI